ncbi:unknown [Choristoneura occidentalis granulovirus]|uniref:Uncharacterized protein n=1 Tax=Choristoneura occidentalis granulovirus TaxID=364745 RepID=Q1A4R8_9BBAC|nr:unknown [Choristoneura fumiferana granulovirus]ABC61162.1 unknown [Choristoneura fumiferana granulovirus]
MHEDIIVLLKNYSKKYNQLEETFQELKHQYDKTQYELRSVKNILLELCSEVAPAKTNSIQELLDKHDKMYKTLHQNGSTPLATIRFAHQLNPDLGTAYVWENF